MTRRRRERGQHQPYLHQIVEARQNVPHALARAFRAGCDCTELALGLWTVPDGSTDPHQRWLIEHGPTCPYALAGVAVYQATEDPGRM